MSYIKYRPSGQIFKGSASPIKVTEFLARSFCTPFGDLAVMKEEWKSVVGYDKYEISSYGRIRSWNYHRNIKNPKEPKIKAQHYGPKGYFIVALWQDGGKSTKRIHRLVLEAFIGPCPEGMEGCHNDGDNQNNHLENLRWDTSKNNHADKIKHGTVPRGESHSGSKLNESDVIDIRQRAVKGEFFTAIARDFKCSPAHIGRIVSRSSWKYLEPKDKQ